MTTLDEVLEARTEYDSAKTAFERANNELCSARQKWERAYGDYQRRLISERKGKTGESRG